MCMKPDVVHLTLCNGIIGNLDCTLIITIVGATTGKPGSHRSYQIQMAYIPTLTTPRYSSFVIIKESTLCFLHDQTRGLELKQST